MRERGLLCSFPAILEKKIVSFLKHLDQWNKLSIDLIKVVGSNLISTGIKKIFSIIYLYMFEWLVVDALSSLHPSNELRGVKYETY